MGLNIQNGESKNSIRQKLNTRVFDLAGGNTITGETNFVGDMQASNISVNSITTNEIHGDITLNGGKVVTNKTPFGNQCVFNVKPSVQGIDFTSLVIIHVTSQGQSIVGSVTRAKNPEINDISVILSPPLSSSEYYFRYSLGDGYYWDSEFYAVVPGGNVDVVVDVSGDRSQQKSGYIASENRMYLYFKSSRVWTPPSDITNVDVFLVGGGQNGGASGGASGETVVYKRSNDGYKTGGEITVNNLPVNITIGSYGSGKGGAGSSSTFGSYKAFGGSYVRGGSSGGYFNESTYIGEAGGSNGDKQGHTTKEFGEDTGKIYAAGGSASGVNIRVDDIGGAGYLKAGLNMNGTPNTGSGGGGRSGGTSGYGGGGSGICVVRWEVE